MRFSFARDLPWANTDSDYDSDDSSDVDQEEEEEEDDIEEEVVGLQETAALTPPTTHTTAPSSSPPPPPPPSNCNHNSNNHHNNHQGATTRPYQQYAVPDPEVGEVSFRHMHFSREGQETTNGFVHLPSDEGDRWICIDLPELRRRID